MRCLPTGRRVQVAGIAQRGYVLETLAVAVAAVLDGLGPEDVLVDAVRIGRDMDTDAVLRGGPPRGVDGEAAVWGQA